MGRLARKTKAELLRHIEALEQRIGELERKDREHTVAEELLRGVLDNTSTPIFIRDVAGRFRLVNRAYEEHSGLDRETVLGKTVDELFPERYAAAFSELDRAVIESGAPLEEEHEVPLPGGIGTVLSIRFPIRDARGEVAFIGSISTDISERKHAERALRASETRFRDFAEASSDWFWEMDDALRYTDFSDRFEEIIGLDRSELLGKKHRDLVLELAPRATEKQRENDLRRHLADLESHHPFRNVFFPMLRRDGATVYLSLSGKPVFDRNRRLIGYRGSGSDITGQIEADRRARTAQSQLAAAIENLSEMFVLFDADDRIVLSNRAWREMNADVAGTTAPGVPWADHMRAVVEAGLIPDAIGAEEEWLARRAAYHANPRGTIEIERAPGRRLQIRVQRLPEGGSCLICRDVTETRRYEQALRESEERFRTIVDHLPLGVNLKDRDGRYLLINRQFEKWYGATDAEIRGRRPEDHLRESRAERDERAAHEQQVIETGAVVTREAVKRGADGDTYQVLIRKFPVFDAGGTVTAVGTACMDVTELKQAQAEIAHHRDHLEQLVAERTRDLRESEVRFQHAVDASRNWIWDWNIETGTVWFSPGWWKGVGLSPAEAAGYTWLDWVHPDDLPEIRRDVIDVLKGNTPYFVNVHRHRHRDGRWIWLEARGAASHDENGRAVRFIGSATDVSERHEMEEALRRSEERLRGAIESLQEGFALFDADDRLVAINERIERMNPAARSILEQGLRFEDLLRRNVERGRIPDTVGREEEFIRQRLEQHRNPGELPEVQEFSDGRWFQIKESRTPEGGIALTGTDITAQMRAERALRAAKEQAEEHARELEAAQRELLHKERLATLGQLTATVSHELRNPLGAMRPSLYLLRKHLDRDDERARRACDRLDRNINRCDRIIDELLDFTRLRTLNLAPVALDEWVAAVIEEQDTPPGIAFTHEPGLAGRVVSVDDSRLRRAVINVYENACQAIVGETGEEIHPGARITLRTRATGDRVVIEITDSGPGIPAAVQPRLFEPLFSTKGFGVGLGLPTVKQIMEQHGGGVEVGRGDGGGTRVVLWLPGSEERE